MNATTATASTTAPSQSQPQRRGPAINIRRYGRTDFERFDEEAARGPYLCVGSASIGKVDIDCKYHWKKAQWGVLGSERTPAGIVYMDLTFKQPHGYWLERASVFVTLSEDMSSYALSVPRREGTTARRTLGSDYAVQITEHYGPRFLTGTKTVVAETKHNEFVPTFGAIGFELGGIGCKSSTSTDRIGRWAFKGTVCKPKGRDGLRTLEWELSENMLDHEQVHNQTYHTAFAFEHSKRPVFMRVEVQGKLRGKTRQMKHGLLKFSSTFGTKDNSTLTELDLRRDVEFKKSLDHIALGLDMAMQMENYEKVPLEVPNPTPARFTQDVGTGSLTAGQIQRPQPHEQLPEPEKLGGDGTQELKENLELQGHGCTYVEGSAADPILDSLRRQLQDRVGSNLAAHIRLEEAMTGSSEPTDDSDGGTTAVNSPSASTSATSLRSPEAIDQATLELVQTPALLMLLRLLATMLQWFSKTKQTIQNPTERPGLFPHGQGQIDNTKLLGRGTPDWRTDWPPWEEQRGRVKESVPSPAVANAGDIQAL